MTPEYHDYFETVAQNHKLIAHDPADRIAFAHKEIGELEGLSRAKMHYPALILFTPSYHSYGTEANQRWRVMGGIAVVDRVERDPSYRVWIETMNAMIDICQDIRAKMEKDRKLYDVSNKQFALPGLEQDAWDIRPLHKDWEPLTGGLMKFAYNLPARHFDLSRWNNEQDYSI